MEERLCAAQCWSWRGRGAVRRLLMVARGKKHRYPESLVRVNPKAGHRDVHTGGRKS